LISLVTPEASASNRRTVDGILKSTSDGDLPNLFAGTLSDGKSKPVGEFGDFMSQLRQRDPDRAGRFEKAVMDKLPEQARAQLTQVFDQDKPAKPAAPSPTGNKNNAPQPAKSPALGSSKPPRVLKGTTFYGGAGMKGAYIDYMIKALEEQGVKNVRAADPKKWSKGHIALDALSVPFENSRDDKQSDFSKLGEEGEQFNLIGYSYGGLQAAQGAIDYADKGGTVDNLVLMGAPVEPGFLKKLKSHPNIKSVKIIDLPERGDPIKAGMSDLDVLGSLPKLGVDSLRNYWNDNKDNIGHFYYSGNGVESQRRRRELARKLFRDGLK